MCKEEFELIELRGLNYKKEIEFCLVVTIEEQRKVFLLSYPAQSQILRKFEYFRKINFN